MIPNGPGPWFCALLFNTSLEEKCKTQTHLAVHTFPHLYIDYFNSKKEGVCWVMVLKIGPFKKWKDACSFHAAWSTNTRGKTRRLEKGLALLDQFRERFHLHAWAEYSVRDECIAKFQNDTRQVIHLVDEEQTDKVVQNLNNIASNYINEMEIDKYEYKRQKV